MSAPKRSVIRSLAALAGAGLAAATTLLVATPAHASTAGGAISRSEVLQRAQTWVDEKVPYSQTTYWTDANGTYREDCSGFVSMAWHLTSSLVTSTLPSVSIKLGSFAQLQPADILDDTAEHTILFAGWTSTSGDFDFYSESQPGVLTGRHSANINDSTIAGHPRGDYGAYQYRNIVGGFYSNSVAFQANTGFLYTYQPGSPATNTQEGMLAGTSPSVAALSNGTSEVAFQANTGFLYTYNSANGPSNTGEGMLTGTSPALASNGAGWLVAFQANTGLLYTLDSAGNLVNTGYGMMAGTNPAVTALSDGSYEIAFQANTGLLYTYNSTTHTASNDQEGMLTGTSPAIAANGTAWQVTFQANTGLAYTYNSTGAVVNTGYGMMTGTSPDITTLSDGSYEIAFQANTGFLWVRNSTTGAGTDTQEGMLTGTSPAIIPNGTGWQVAFQADNGLLFTDTNGAISNSGYGMYAGTNPTAG